MEIVRSESARTSSRSNSTISNAPSNCSKQDLYVSLKHYDCLLGELRCPGCARPMHAPILLCQSGHSVCQECVRKQKSCPLCRMDFTDIRSMTLEALSAKAYFSCKNAISGCTVRLPFDLMKWHKPRCLFQTGSCFMGTIWGGCNWNGRKMDYLEHCSVSHRDKLFLSDEAQLFWPLPPVKSPTAKTVVGVFMFNVFEEVFDLYHVHDRTGAQCLWTMVCESKERKTSTNFAFQIELFCQKDPSRLLVQRHSCHSERDDDLLDEAHCVAISMGDIMRFTGGDKKLHYRVKILDLRECKTNSTATQPVACQTCVPSPKVLQDAETEPIECTNHKCVPMSNIITKKCSKKIAIGEKIAEVPPRNALTNGTIAEVNKSTSLNGSVSSLDVLQEKILTQSTTTTENGVTKSIDTPLLPKIYSV
ncbi:E3 ubiquitin-protein ligase SIAH1B isoform X2 [Phlebotomus papatasi]|uniref:E3 ubiquitin-protein ligase SIAH1B isoform X2 n=1 Tax=Phlebotomus papatasi TaxID=29031 RepID=UPI0024837BFC|nr:E3 ubiquitin-protein ligase SIAH1B isoform X2 [Phlebotomus papatasi]